MHCPNSTRGLSLSARGGRESLLEEVFLGLPWKEGWGDWQVGGYTHLQHEGVRLGDAGSLV